MGTPTDSAFVLPPIARLDPALVEAGNQANAALAHALDGANQSLQRAFRFVQWRLLREATAAVEPPLSEQLIPARRRYLSREQQLRVDGCAMALRHLDSRVAMQRAGAIDHVVGPETPMVLHAFVEAGIPGDSETNAGSLRATPSSLADGGRHIEFAPPPPEHCRRLLLDAIETANDAPAPPIARASWLLAVVFAVHPFVDGNGRTGRLMFHGLASEHSPCGIDWGTMPELEADRFGYIEAARMQVQNSRPTYDGRRLEPGRLMSYLATQSIAGADRARERLAALGAVLDHLSDAGLGDEDALLVLAVAADRNTGLADLDRFFDDRSNVTRIVNSLVAEGWLRWDRAGRLQLVGANPFKRAAASAGLHRSNRSSDAPRDAR